MIEILFIFLQLFFLIIFFSGPFYFLALNNLSVFKLNIFDYFGINILVNTTFLLICSFFNLKILYIFYAIIFFNLFLFLKNKKLILNRLKKFRGLKIIFFFIICLISISFYLAYDPTLSWDGIEHWFWKALNYNQSGSYENLKNMPLAYYPHLGSYIWGFFWSINPINLEYLGRFFYILIFLIPFFSASYRLGNVKDEYKIIIILILVTLALDRFLLGGYQEFFLFYLFYMFSLICYIKESKNNILLTILIFISCSLMIWIKQEGLFYLIILSFVHILSSRSKTINKLIFISCSFLIIFLTIEIRKYFHGNFNLNEEIFHSGLLRYLDISILVKSIFYISIEIFKGFVKYPLWILIILFLSLDLVKYKKILNIKYIFFILFIGFIFAIYLQTSMDMRQLMPLTLDRILFHGSGFYLIYIFKKIKELSF
jgi:hypothetical protein